MRQLQVLGLVETNGKHGRDRIWNLTTVGLRALAEGNELPSRPRAGAGARGIRAGFGPHGIAVTETILAYGGRRHLTGWRVEVDHAIKTIGLSFSTDAVLTLPTATSEVRLFEAGNGAMTRARLVKEVGVYERYAGHRVWEGARGTVGRSYDFWARHRYPRSRLFPILHVVLTGLPEHRLQRRLQALARDVGGITVAVLATTLPRLKRGEAWYELAVDDSHRRRTRYPQVFNR
ncbi:hypothetical protein ADL21_09240 [Streptomyces albus subsp. albus]|nr:hypothetical protein ADL21_09240 [Streptomyces albus subsp. albus]